MTVHIEALNEKDRQAIEKGKKKRILTVLLSTSILALCIYVSNTENTGTLQINLDKLVHSPLEIFIVLFGLAFIIAFIIDRRKANEDLGEGKKEILIGPITKRRGGKNNSKHYFHIDTEKIRVSKKEYQQYENGEVLKIARAPKSHYTLSVEK